MKMEMKKKKKMMMMMGDPPEGPRPTEKAPELRKYLKESKVGMEDRQDPECLPFLHRAYLPVFSTSLLPGLHLPGVPPPNCTCPPASRTRTQGKYTEYCISIRLSAAYPTNRGLTPHARHLFIPPSYHELIQASDSCLLLTLALSPVSSRIASLSRLPPPSHPFSKVYG
ncbi:hypothetical protein BDP67DRAFT_567468 [Colletotrichum lupini]|nr:hypothetical protein BDP67DRAFT_567468 [Colletotrichum lupini]